MHKARSVIPFAVTAALLSALSLAPPPVEAQSRATADRIWEAVGEEAHSAVARYREFLSLPNDAHYPEDMTAVIAWVEAEFAHRGFSIRRLPTPGSPLVLAERRVSADGPTVLVYFQSDGQPVDPDEWYQENPYGPVLKAPDPSAEATGGYSIIDWNELENRPPEEWDPEWRIFARSASDSKGPIAQFLAAWDIADSEGWLPTVNLKLIIDTEEEMGSPHLPQAVLDNREALASDMLIIMDGPPHISGEPSLKFGARGISRFTLTTYGPRVAQHSGHYGNYAPNPGMRLSRLLASMKDEHGRVTIPGFYDGIELSDEVKAILAAVPDDEEEIHARLGIAEPDRVAGSLQEAVQYPSLNVRGMESAWIGDEARTIVPPTATAEVDVRLVMESDPERLMGLIRQHIEDQGYLVLDRDPTEEERRTHPRIARFNYGVSYLAYRTDFDAWPGRWLRQAYTSLYGGEPILIRTSGGSIPISPFVITLGIPAVGVPTVNPDNNQHSPNENIRLSAFLEGIGVMTAVLAQPLPDS
jgi:acetylornithine deacetylase/succinyl-diaminopimelate desuccinylase-like protein